ncbi:MAG: DUF5719 family protein [Actinomycetota bacterium]
MRTRLREWGLTGVVAAMILLGLLIEGIAGEVAEPAPAPLEGPRFVERAVFCPPSLSDTKTILTPSSGGEETVTVGIEPTRPQKLKLPPKQLLVQQLPNQQPAVVSGFGERVDSGVLLRTQAPFAGEAASRCSERAAVGWYFAAGSSTLGADQRLLIYNPFPDEAVVRVSFLTAGAEIRKPGLNDVAVPSRSAAFVRINRYVRLQRVLAARVEAERGRVVAWKVLFDRPQDGSKGVQMSLGVHRTATTWYFPEGAVVPGIDTRIAIANPDPDSEAVVTMSLSTGDRVVQPPELVEMAIPALSARVIPLEFSLPRGQRDLGGVSVIVQSTNDTGIIAERTIRYSDGTLSGSSSEIGASVTSRRWLVQPATLNPSTDTLVVMNPGGERATFDVEILRDGREPLAPRKLSDRSIRSGGRLKLGLGEWTAGDTAALLVTSSDPVVVERVSYSSIPNDVGAVMGIPWM